MPRIARRTHIAFAACLAAALLLAVFSGCGAKKKAKELLGTGELKKVVLLVPPAADRSGSCGESFAGAFRSALAREGEGLAFMTDPALSAVFAFDPTSISGPAPGPALMAQARAQGINAIFLSRFSGPFIEKKKTGLYGFRKMREVGQIHYSLWIYDTLTGAKLADLELSRESVLDDTWPGQAKEVLACPEDVLADLAEEAAEEACEALAEQPWSCQVLAVDGDTVTISAGSDAGLSTYRTLSVRARGEEVNGRKGRVYLLPGAVIGTIRISSVSEKTSTAVLASGEKVAPGDWVFAKE